MLAALARTSGMLVAASLLAFAMLRAMPGDPAEIALAAWNVAATPETVGALRRQWGLDEALPLQYLRWLGRFLSGDWGVSFRTGRPIATEMLQRAPLSATLGLGALALALALAIPLGFFAALRPGGSVDRLSRGLNVLSQSVPSFLLGLLLLWLLGVKLQLLRPFSGDPWTRLLLPTGLVALYSAGTLARVYRAELLAVVRQPYFLTARAKGLGETRALWAHGHGAAFYGVVAALVPEFAWVVGGTAVTEVVFALPGLSQFLVQSIGARDYFVLQAYVVLVACWMLLVRLAVDVILHRLEPRLR